MKRIVLMLALLSLIALPCLAGEPAAGDNLFGVTYGYTAQDVDFDARTTVVGLNYERYVTEDFSMEVGAFTPLDVYEVEFYSGNVGLNYHFGPLFYLPIRGTYSGTENAFLIGSGFGLNFFAGPLNLRFSALMNYSLDAAVEDKTSFAVEGAVRFSF